MRSNRKKKTIEVFISYRRVTGREIARNIYERLTLQGINTFFDYNSMRNGKFNEQIYTAIEQASDFIFIFSPHALDNCENPEDWVRLEIQHALKFNKNIVIVFTDSDIEFPENLPSSIKEITFYQGMQLSQDYYDESIAKLIGMLKSGKNDKWYKKISPSVFYCFIAFVIITVGLIFILKKNPDKKNSYLDDAKLTAELYLPRYSDINHHILDSPYFNEEVLDQFEYVDTIIDSTYTVLAQSRYLTAPENGRVEISVIDSLIYHNLVLQLRLGNLTSQTVIVNHAELELTDIIPVNYPLLSVSVSNGNLYFLNQNSDNTPAYKLSVSTLHNGESLLQFKDVFDVKDEKFVYSLSDSDKIAGKIEDEDYSWNFSYNNSTPSPTQKTKFEHHVSIEPKNDFNVFYVDVKSKKQNQSFLLKGFDRKLIDYEIDDRLYVIVSSNFSFSAKARVKLVTSRHKEIFSKPISITYLHPKSFKNEPF